MRHEKAARRRRCLRARSGFARGAFGDNLAANDELGYVSIALRSALESASRLRLIGAFPLPARGQVQNTKIHFNPLPKIPMTHRAPPVEKLLTRQACCRPSDPDRQLPVAEVRSFQALDGLRVERDKVALDLGAIGGLSAGVAAGAAVGGFGFHRIPISFVTFHRNPVKILHSSSLTGSPSAKIVARPSPYSSPLM